MRDEEDLNLICGMEDEMLKRQHWIGYARQTRCGAVVTVENFTMECVQTREHRATLFNYREGHGVFNVRCLTNGPSGLIHYSHNSKPLTTQNKRMVHLPDDNYVGFGIISGRDG